MCDWVWDDVLGIRVEGTSSTPLRISGEVVDELAILGLDIPLRTLELHTLIFPDPVGPITLDVLSPVTIIL